MAARHRHRPGTLVLTGWLVVAPGAAAWAQASGVAAEAPRATEGREIDRVVAIIEGQVLTRSELEFETRVAFIERGAVQAAFAPLDDETLRGALELVIGQRLQVLSADRLEAFPAEQAEVEDRLDRFRQRFESAEAFQAFLARSGADTRHLIEVLKRNVRAERILDSRIRLKAQVSEAEVKRYFEQHESEYPQGFGAVKAQLRDKLFQERYKALAAEELAQVRDSAQVRRVAPFAREGRR